MTFKEEFEGTNGKISTDLCYRLLLRQLDLEKRDNIPTKAQFNTLFEVGIRQPLGIYHLSQWIEREINRKENKEYVY